MHVANNRITFTLNELVHHLNSHADAILRARFELTFSQYLFLLSLRDESKSLTEAAQWQGVSVAAISKRIAWFEERNLISSSADPNHGRKLSLSLTAKGRSLVDKSSEFMEEAFQHLFKGMSEINLSDLNKKLNLIITHLENKPKESK